MCLNVLSVFLHDILSAKRLYPSLEIYAGRVGIWIRIMIRNSLRIRIRIRNDILLRQITASIDNVTYLARVVGELEPLNHILVFVPDFCGEDRSFSYVVPEIC
jgi:hypothetical protein